MFISESIEKTLKRKKHKSKDHHHHHQSRKHKKSRSKSKRRSSTSPSPEPTTSTAIKNHNVVLAAASPLVAVRQRQIMNIGNLPNLSQENIKIILKNDDALFAKRQKKRDKKSKREKISRKEEKKEKSQKAPKEQPQTKEVFQSGDNILISVCFNNNNTKSSNNNSTNSNNDPVKLKPDTAVVVNENKVSAKTKSKKRQASPPSAISSADSFERLERRQRKHRRKRSKKKDHPSSNMKSPRTPPMNPPQSSSNIQMAKRKNDSKPIAIIDLEKSPGKEILQSPKEVIVLSDSDGDGAKKRDSGSNDIVIIDDLIMEKGNSGRNYSPHMRDRLTPTNATPESPPPQNAAPPVLKFALKSKSNILPFNLLHDQAEEIEEPSSHNGNSSLNNNNNNANVGNESQQQHGVKNSSHHNEQQDVVNSNNCSSNNNNNNLLDDKAANNNLNEAYDPFEPTKSGSTSPVTPPPPSCSHDVANINESNKTKMESSHEKVQFSGMTKESSHLCINSDDHQPTATSSLWNKKSQQPTTPPLPPTFVYSSSTSNLKAHASLYDGIYGSDLKTPVVPSPIKSLSHLKSSHMDKNLKSNNNNNIDDDDDDDNNRTPYSPSSDGYDYEPAPTTSMHQNKSNFENLKHSDIDTQSSEISGSYSFGNDDASTTKVTPLKLTASTLKTFNSTMSRSSSGPVGLQFVNKAELSIFENYIPPATQKSPLVKRQSNTSFIRSKMSRFTSSMNENGSPHRTSKPAVIGEFILSTKV